MPLFSSNLHSILSFFPLLFNKEPFCIFTLSSQIPRNFSVSFQLHFVFSLQERKSQLSEKASADKSIFPKSQEAESGIAAEKRRNTHPNKKEKIKET
jgi:hypothetical protein